MIDSFFRPNHNSIQLIYQLLFAITLSSVSLLPQKSSQEFKSLFDEYESQETIESQIVKELDRFDVMLQAFQYEKSEFEAKGRQIKFQEFFDNAIGKIKSKQLIDLSEALHRQRTQFWLNVESDKQSNKQ